MYISFLLGFSEKKYPKGSNLNLNVLNHHTVILSRERMTPLEGENLQSFYQGREVVYHQEACRDVCMFLAPFLYFLEILCPGNALPTNKIHLLTSINKITKVFHSHSQKPISQKILDQVNCYCIKITDIKSWIISVQQLRLLCSIFINKMLL